MKLIQLYERDTKTAGDQSINWWSTNRHWYHPKTGTHYAVDLKNQRMNHSLMVYENPEMFGIPQGELPKPKRRDYDGPTLYRAMQNGWVRVMVDRRNPDTGTNIEGLWFPGLAQTAETMGNVVMNVRNVAIIKRTGPGNRDGVVFLIPGFQMEEFIVSGRPPNGTQRAVESLRESGPVLKR